MSLGRDRVGKARPKSATIASEQELLPCKNHSTLESEGESAMRYFCAVHDRIRFTRGGPDGAPPAFG